MPALEPAPEPEPLPEPPAPAVPPGDRQLVEQMFAEATIKLKPRPDQPPPPADVAEPPPPAAPLEPAAGPEIAPAAAAHLDQASVDLHAVQEQRRATRGYPEYPVQLVDSFRNQGAPVFRLSVSAAKASIDADCDTVPVVVNLVESIGRALSQQFDVQIGPIQNEDVNAVAIRVLKIDGGKKAKRGLLGIGGHATLEVEGEILAAHRSARYFYFEEKGSGLGGDALHLLNRAAGGAGKKVLTAIQRHLE